MFSTRSFVLFNFTLRTIMPFEFLFVFIAWEGIQGLFSFTYGHQIFSAWFIENIIFCTLNFFVKFAFVLTSAFPHVCLWAPTTDFIFYLIDIRVQLLYIDVLVSAVQQSDSAICICMLYVCMYLLFVGFPSHSGHHRALSRVPCAIQDVFISYLFYT